MTRFSALALALVASAAAAFAQEFKAGDLVVEKPWARATPKGAEVGAGFLIVRNAGVTPDRLTVGSADFATVEIHEMKTENGVMRMPEVKGGLDVPAHGSVVLAPGGYHLMFNHLTHPLTKGDTVRVTLNFLRMTLTALPMTSAGRFSPLGPVSIVWHCHVRQE